jgi:hypothetical protein
MWECEWGRLKKQDPELKSIYHRQTTTLWWAV